MTGCGTCPCRGASSPPCTGTLLLSTAVDHTLVALRSAVRESGAVYVERGPGLLEVQTADPAQLLAAARMRLSSVEAAEVRVAEVDLGADLLLAAFAAPSLAQAGARAEHADLLPLFADELASFRSDYQPIVALGEQRSPVVGYEALLRAQGPAGPLLPSELFGAAERAGWLHVLDRVGRTTALRGAESWLGDRLLFVNFLPTTIYRPQVCLRTTEQAAREAGLRLDQLVFEVTESERVTDLAHLADVFAYYRDRGCKVALDDLGAGYSSLNLLVQLQPDVVKLDKQIVQRLPDPASAAVVTAVVEIAHSYGGQVLAECVETASQAAAARELGVDLGQGWYFGRPQPRPDEDATRARRTAGTAAGSPTGALVRASAWSGNDAAVALVERASELPSSAVSAARGNADVEALLAHAVDVSSAGCTIADATRPDMPLIYVNAAFERMTGYRQAEVLGRNCRFLQGPDTRSDVVRELQQAIAQGRDHVAVLRNYRKTGEPWENELHLSPVKDAQGRVTHYFGFQHDVTARVHAEQEAAYLADHDALTGLPNRRRLLQTLQQHLDTATPTGKRLAVLFIDLDGFKAVNDRLGHAAGDLVLTASAACLRGALREHDVLARYSGDEFVAVLPDVPPDSAQRIAQRTGDALLDSLTGVQVDGERIGLSASVGVALYPDHATTVDALLDVADAAMYAAKQAGRSRAHLACRPPERP